MKRGVSFLIPNAYGRYLAEILEPINCSKYQWKLERSTEMWKKVPEQRDEDLFDDANVVAGVDFDDLIKRNIYYIIFATINAFPNGTQLSNIDTYEDYVKSDCEICLLIADCSYVEVYCKDPLLINKLYDNANAKGFEKLGYINEENDYRTKMST